MTANTIQVILNDIKNYIVVTIVFGSINTQAQGGAKESAVSDTASKSKMILLTTTTITGIKGMNGVERLPDSKDAIIYSGQKNTVLVLDSMNSNTSQSSMRQELGRIPGAQIAEAQYNGFPYNGIGFRGFNGTQSVNMDMRQNGYNITADVYGHPETYYSPPSEAVQDIEVISGESSLEFGPQFAGVINYVLKDAPSDKPFQFTESETAGTYGLFNNFTSVGGTLGKWSYFAWDEYQSTQGWRPNSQLWMNVGYAKLQYKANKNLSISAEYSIQRNLIHMAGGLDDAEFARNPDTSTRPRNWMENPANFAAITLKWKMTSSSFFSVQSVLNSSSRLLTWRNDDIPIGFPDSITPGNPPHYAPREVESWYALNSTTEIRYLSNYNIGSNFQTFSAGVRLYWGTFYDNDRGSGTTGLNYDLTMVGPGQTYGRSVWIHDYNVAPFVQNTFRIGKLSITPGFRYEYLSSVFTGYYTNWDSAALAQNTLGTVDSLQKRLGGSFTRNIPLAGIGLQFAASKNTNIYTNFTQAYDPVNYEDLYPDIDLVVNPNLHDVHGYNSDLGIRGNIKNCVDFDIGGFYSFYEGALGTVPFNVLPYSTGRGEYSYNAASGTIPYNDTVEEETNAGNAVHAGIESYIDWNIVKTFTKNSRKGYIDIFNAFCYDNAKYVSGTYSGNRAEDAPQYIIRSGLSYIKPLDNGNLFSATLFMDYTSMQFTDAANTVVQPEYAEVGIIPAYRLYDFATTLRIKNYVIKAGIDNLANVNYFTMRVVEYPGPGIIPGVTRTGYIGLSATF